jgi:hypothetical protein
MKKTLMAKERIEGEKANNETKTEINTRNEGSSAVMGLCVAFILDRLPTTG